MFSSLKIMFFVIYKFDFILIFWVICKRFCGLIQIVIIFYQVSCTINHVWEDTFLYTYAHFFLDICWITCTVLTAFESGCSLNCLTNDLTSILVSSLGLPVFFKSIIYLYFMYFAMFMYVIICLLLAILLSSRNNFSLFFYFQIGFIFFSQTLASPW